MFFDASKRPPRAALGAFKTMTVRPDLEDGHPNSVTVVAADVSEPVLVDKH
jgi:hypothetical protein